MQRISCITIVVLSFPSSCLASFPHLRLNPFHLLIYVRIIPVWLSIILSIVSILLDFKIRISVDNVS